MVVKQQAISIALSVLLFGSGCSVTMQKAQRNWFNKPVKCNHWIAPVLDAVAAGASTIPVIYTIAHYENINASMSHARENNMEASELVPLISSSIIGALLFIAFTYSGISGTVAPACE